MSKKIAAQKMVLAAIQAGLFSVDESTRADALDFNSQQQIFPNEG